MNLFGMSDAAFDAMQAAHMEPVDQPDACCVCGERGFGFRSFHHKGEWYYLCSSRCISAYGVQGHKSREEEEIRWR